MGLGSSDLLNIVYPAFGIGFSRSPRVDTRLCVIGKAASKGKKRGRKEAKAIAAFKRNGVCGVKIALLPAGGVRSKLCCQGSTCTGDHML